MALLSLAVSGGAVLAHAVDRSPGEQVRGQHAEATDPDPVASTVPGPSASPRTSREHDGGGRVKRPIPQPSACTYEDGPSRTRVPKATPKAKGPIGASAVVQISGVVSAEGWVPPPGQTCPPEP
jgi:hypothetical protein